jgi:hypothetical protein
LPLEVNKKPVPVEAFLVLIISFDPALGLFTQVDNVQELVFGMTDETIETYEVLPLKYKLPFWKMGKLPALFALSVP